ncbi:BTAD domain-containing putative transcriptional regulator [Spirillospora sp. NPDC127200]
MSEWKPNAGPQKCALPPPQTAFDRADGGLGNASESVSTAPVAVDAPHGGTIGPLGLPEPISRPLLADLTGGQGAGRAAVQSATQPRSGLIRLLGAYTIEGAGGRREVTTTDTRALLGLLAEHRTMLLSSEEMVAKLWAGALPSPERHRTVLKDARGKLCEALGQSADRGKDLIENVRASGCRLNPDLVTCDVWQFRDLLAAAAAADDHDRHAILTAAVNLHEGPYLSGVTHGWARSAARSITGELVQALSQLAALETDPELAAAHLERAAGVAPATEHLHRRLMQHYAKMNKNAAVHHTYQRLTEHLAERGAKPEMQTVRLYSQLVGE